MAGGQGDLMDFDKIGYWSELKLDIVKKYAKAYSTILTAKAKHLPLKHVYIDGFSGPGVHISKTSKQFIQGSPLNALAVEPPFTEYFLIDLDGDKVAHLRSLVGERNDVHILQGDCNPILLEEVLPKIQWEDYWRGLCLLDPYALHLDWQVIELAAKLKTIEIFLNFPIMDINRNVLWRNPEAADPTDRERMTRFWGDDTWASSAYKRSKQGHLFDEPEMEKQDNADIAEAFRKRLKEVAGFANVPEPLPMRNSKGAVVYYLFFASQNDTGNKIVEGIFAPYRNRRS
jgi:three-Cys-motif partner protein